jgi:hypothetical protein
LEVAVSDKLTFASKKFAKFVRDELRNAHPRDLKLLERLSAAERQRQTDEIDELEGVLVTERIDLNDTE